MRDYSEALKIAGETSTIDWWADKSYTDLVKYIKILDRGLCQLHAEHEALKEATRWRSVDDELPENSGFYLTATRYMIIREYYRLPLNGFDHDVTHWKPIELPK